MIRLSDGDLRRPCDHRPFGAFGYYLKWKVSTKETNEARIRAHLTRLYEGRTLASFRRDERQDLLDAKAHAGFSHSVVAHLRWDLRQILRMAVEEELLSRNPAELLFVPREAPRPEYATMSLEQIATCLKALKNRERLVLKLAVLAGLRPGEIFGLKWRHLLATHANICQRVYRGGIDTPKTQRSFRNAALPSGLLAEIEDWRAASRMNGRMIGYSLQVRERRRCRETTSRAGTFGLD